MGGGTNASACIGIAMPGGTILGIEVGGRNGCACLHRDCGTQKCDPRSDGKGGYICSGRGIGFCMLPQLLSSSIWVIVNTIALALDNTDTLCCETTLLGRIQAVRQLLNNTYLFSSLCP